VTSADAALIKEHLESLGDYDPKRLEKYMDFITEAPWLRQFYEEHHILPRCIFPCFTECQWNIKRLSLRDHVWAHYLLGGALPKNRYVKGCYIAIVKRAPKYSYLKELNTRAAEYERGMPEIKTVKGCPARTRSKRKSIS
jgi:hypothetical protein